MLKKIKRKPRNHEEQSRRDLPFGISIGKSRSRRASKTDNNVHLHRIVNNHPSNTSVLQFLLPVPLLLPVQKSREETKTKRAAAAGTMKRGTRDFGAERRSLALKEKFRWSKPQLQHNPLRKISVGFLFSTFLLH